MAFVDERAKVARKPAYIIDVFWDTGTIRYCDFAVPPGQAMQSIVQSVKVAPTRKSTGSGVGSRALYNIKLNDTVADDGVGTVLGRLLGANPFYRRRQIDIYVGYLTDVFDISNFQKRTYFIDNISALNDTNTITINTIDPLESLNDRRSTVPLVSFANLSVAINAVFTGSINIGDTTNFDVAGGHCLIDKEMVSYLFVSATNINITARGTVGTTADDHSINRSVKNSYVRSITNVVDLIRDIILDFTDVNPAFIPNAQWNAERDDFLATEDMTLVVPTSKSVKTIVNQLCEQAGVSIWWDERVSEIPLKSDVPALFPEFFLTTEQNILDTGHKQTQDMRKLVTRVIYHFNKIDKAGSDDAENYADTLETIDSQNETDLQEQGIIEIFGSYTLNSGTAVKVSSRLITRRKRGAKEVFWNLDPKDGDVWTGNDVRMTSDLFQNASGEDTPFLIEVVEVKEVGGTLYKYRGTIISEDTHNLYALIGPNSLVDYAFETQQNRDKYGFISTNPPDPQMSDGSAPYRIL